MIQESEVRNCLAAYLRRELSLEAFSDWLGERSWNMHRDSSDSAKRLAGAVELLLAEYSKGHRTEGELRLLLQRTLEGMAVIGVEVASSGIRPFDESSIRLPVRPISTASYLELIVTF